MARHSGLFRALASHASFLRICKTAEQCRPKHITCRARYIMLISPSTIHLARASLYARSGFEQAESEEVMNVALRVADELSGCDSNRRSGYALWSSALTALHRRGRALDSDNLERLFWRDNRHVRIQPPPQLPLPLYFFFWTHQTFLQRRQICLLQGSAARAPPAVTSHLFLYRCMQVDRFQ